MKKFTAISAASLLLAACGDSRPTYLLSGTVDTLYDGATVSLVYGEKSDSTVVAQGAFRFEGRIDAPVLARVLVTKGDKRTGGMVVLEGGSPLVTFTEEGYDCSGTPLNETLNAYNAATGELYRNYRQTYAALREQGLEQEAFREAVEQAGDAFSAGSRKLNEEFFASNRDNVLGSVVIARLADGRAQFDSLYNVAGKAVRNAPSVQQEKARYENLDKTAEGKMFTDFTVEKGSAEGGPVSLSDYVGKGKYVLVDFWASWCGPCRAEMPNLAEVYKKYKGDRFEILGVAVWDKRADTERALGSLPITWPVIFDAGTVPTDLYGIKGIPQIILFGPDGTIVARNLRGDAVGAKVGECLGE